MSDFPYVWNWDECSGCPQKRSKPKNCFPGCKGYRPVNRGRKGTRCRARTFGAKGTVLVEFEDGAVIVASRRALRKASHRGDAENAEEAKT